MRSSSKRRRLRSAALLTTWLLLSPFTTACCKTPPPVTLPETVVVDSTELRQTENPDEFIVTRGWLLRRLEYEQALLDALQECEATTSEESSDSSEPEQEPTE